MSVMSDTSIHRVLDKDDWNYNKLKSFLERDDSSINELESPASGTPLHRVLHDEKCCPCVVKLLIEHGANVNAQIRYYGSPLLISLHHNRNKAIVKLLLEAGAKIHTNEGRCDYYLCNVFSTCCSVDLIRMVIGAGSSLNSCSLHETGLNCLMDSVLHTSYMNTGVLELLLENCTRADVDRPAENGQSVLCYALGKDLEIDKVHIVKRLLGVGCSLSTCRLHNSPWFCAADHTSYFRRMSIFTQDIVQLLIEKGATADCFNEFNESPLHCALQNCKYEIGAIELMLDKAFGEIKGLKSEQGLTVLHAAMRNRHCKPSVVKLLVNRGVDVNEGDSDGRKPLHNVLIESPYEKFDIVKALIENGASVNTVTLSGETPLRIAVERGYDSDIIEMLLRKGARLSREQGWDCEMLQFVLRKYERLQSEEEIIPIYKVFLKFALLQNRFIQIEHLKQEVWDFGDFIGFTNKCRNELQQMESTSIDRIDGISAYTRSLDTSRPIGTLYRLVHRCFQLQTTVDFELGLNNQMFYQFLKLLENNDFSVYFDVLSSLVDRDSMEKKLKGITLYTVKSSDACPINTKIILNYLCVCNIATFLPDDDLLRLIIASNVHLKTS